MVPSVIPLALTANDAVGIAVVAALLLLVVVAAVRLARKRRGAAEERSTSTVHPAVPSVGPQARSRGTPTPTPTSTSTASSTAAHPERRAATGGPESRETPTAIATPKHLKVGAEKCKGCHRIQYDSWAATAHKAKGLDCEGCHGNGADYKAASVMKDRAAAVAAGLVLPDPAQCKRCHAKADAALLPRAHTHKAK